ncbi:MAG: penicillin-binding protein 2 [Desulfobacteraceae bacterium]|jgi:cell division protein FtsI (penicillin-binding protein 3)
MKTSFRTKTNISERNGKSLAARELAVAVFFSVLFLVIAGRAVHVHVFQGTWLAEQAKSQYNKYMVTCGKRGTIYDAKNQELAVSLEVTSLGAFPKRMDDKKEVANKLAKVLGLNAWDLRKKLQNTTSFTWIKRKISPKAVAEIKKFKLPGLEFVGEHNRFYPNRGLAAHVIGFTDTDGKGLEGVEFQYDQELYSAPDKFLVTRDARGKRFNTSDGYTTGFQGNNVVLTIDRQIQYLAEKALNEAAKEFQARYGTAVVMNPNTGAILAMAQYPGFNPNAFGKSNKDLWRNRAITDPYEPGSTLKVILAAAALEAHLLTPTSSFYCENGSYRVGGNKVNDTHPYEWLTVQQIIKYSSNIGAVKISEITGKTLLYETLTDFGFGKNTGIDCPGETPGILSNCKKWRTIDTGAISFGQGISVSAVQLLTAVSAIANGGNLMKPHIVQSVVAPDGTLVKNCEIQSPKRVISAETSEKVKEIMASVVAEGGTGVNAALSKYTVCGKTGTAQKIDSGRYSADKYNSSFVGFAPKNNPQVAVLVILDEPKNAHYGGTVAAPAFKRIIHETLNYMNVEPENDNNDDTILLAQRFETKRDGVKP